MATKLCLRVNGIDIPKVRVRNRLENGTPYGKPEVVIDIPAMENLPGLGEMVLEDNTGLEKGLPAFKVEVRENSSQEWRTVSTSELTEILTGKAFMGGK